MDELPNPITRSEQYLAKIAGAEPTLPTPITREERYLAKIAGEDVDIPPAPITRTEQYLAAIVEGGGGGVEVESLSVNANGTYTAEEGKAYSPVSVSVPNTYAAGDEGKVVSNGALVAQTSDSVTENGTVDTTLINSLTVNVAASGGWELLGEWNEEISTASTSLITVATKTISLTKDPHATYVFIIRDKAGLRNGYYTGSDCYVYETDWAWRNSPENAVYLNRYYSYNNALTIKLEVSVGTSNSNTYGVWVGEVTSTSFKIFAKYSSSYSKTIDGTFNIRLYKLPFPANADPLTYSFPNT